MRNSIGNTALHEAMFFPICYEAINLLFRGDPNAAYILNEDGKSSLCLATPDKQIVGLLLLASYGNRGLIGRFQLELPFLCCHKNGKIRYILYFYFINFLLSCYLTLFNLINN